MQRERAGDVGGRGVVAPCDECSGVLADDAVAGDDAAVVAAAVERCVAGDGAVVVAGIVEDWIAVDGAAVVAVAGIIEGAAAGDGAVGSGVAVIVKGAAAVDVGVARDAVEAGVVERDGTCNVTSVVAGIVERAVSGDSSTVEAGVVEHPILTSGIKHPSGCVHIPPLVPRQCELDWREAGEGDGACDGALLWAGATSTSPLQCRGVFSFGERCVAGDVAVVFVEAAVVEHTVSGDVTGGAAPKTVGAVVVELDSGGVYPVICRAAVVGGVVEGDSSRRDSITVVAGVVERAVAVDGAGVVTGTVEHPCECASPVGGVHIPYF